MNNTFLHILKQTVFSASDLEQLLCSQDEQMQHLLNHAAIVRDRSLGKQVFLRGLIELSNYCKKNCYYCGIRKDNKNSLRYTLEDEEVLRAAEFAYKNNYASLAIQAGELATPQFTSRIARLIEKIHQLTNHSLGITLSLGEQSRQTYQQWRNAGAHRYLLRIETSNPDLYKSIHPDDDLHDYDTRLECLQRLRDTGFQVGTGIMIGLPQQSIHDLVNDLLFLKEQDIDMCGMGPYIEHRETPLYPLRDSLLPKMERLHLTLKMIACLRLLLPDINIAATTALQTILSEGRELALQAGANVLMPNITPSLHRNHYALYEGKPQIAPSHEIEDLMQGKTHYGGLKIAFGEQGNSLHYRRRTNHKD